MNKRQKDPNRLSFREVFWYDTGDLANNLIAQMVLVYLLVFYTDIFGIPARAAGTIFIVTHLSAVRTIFTVAGALSVAVAVPQIAGSVTGGNLQTDYPIAMGIFVIIGVFIYFMVSTQCQERYVAEKAESLNLRACITFFPTSRCLFCAR